MIEDVTYQVLSYTLKNPNETDRLIPLIDQLREEGEAILSRTNMRGHITTSMFVLNYEHTHGLIIEHKASGLMLQPGGHFEDSPSMLASALREVLEETGVVAAPLSEQPLDISSHAIRGRPAKGETDHYHHDVCYLGHAKKDAVLVHQEEEVGSAQWVPLDELLQSHSRMQRLTGKVNAWLKERA